MLSSKSAVSLLVLCQRGIYALCPRCSYLLFCSNDGSIYGHCLSVMVLFDLLAMLLCLFSLGQTAHTVAVKLKLHFRSGHL